MVSIGCRRRTARTDSALVVLERAGVPLVNLAGSRSTSVAKEKVNLLAVEIVVQTRAIV